MTKKQLVSRLARRFETLDAAEVRKSVDLILNHFGAHLINEHRAEIRGFGSFVLRTYKTRMILNLNTGLTVQLPSRRAVRFRPAKAFQRRLNMLPLRD